MDIPSRHNHEIVQQDVGVEVRDGGKGYSTARLQIKLALGPVTSVLFGWDQFDVVPMQRRR